MTAAPAVTPGPPPMTDQIADPIVPDDAPSPSKRPSGRAKVILIVLLLAAIVGGVAWFLNYQNVGRFMESTDDARIEADMVTVSPRVSGYVAQVLVRENQDVAAGQPLVRIDRRTIDAQAAQADAQIAVATAQADAARAQLNEQSAAIAQAQAQLASARAKAMHDAAEVARYRPLAESGAETRQQLATLELAARQSADQVRAQAAALVIQQRRVASVRSQIAQGQAQQQAARAQRTAASVDEDATLLTAAVAGRIGDRTVTPGQYAQAGSRLMSIVPLNALYVTANFKETQLALMRPGQPVRIEVDALDGVELRGRIESLSPGTGAQFSILPPQNATGNFTKITQRVPVRVAIQATPAARRLLVPGLSVTVTVDTRSAKGDLERIREQQSAAVAK